MKKESDLKRAGDVLIIVDMINGFVKEGALVDKNIAGIIPEIERLAAEYLANGDKVIAFKDCHTLGSPELKTFPPHCIAGTKEVELVPELKKYEKEFIVFEKNSTSGFVVPAFFEYIQKMNNSTKVVITGCCSDICIMNLAIPLKNFFNQINKNVEIIVPENAVDTYNIPELHDRDEWNNMAFKFMRQAGIQVVNKL